MREIKQIPGPVGHLSIKVLKQSMPAAAPMQEPIVATVVLTHFFSLTTRPVSHIAAGRRFKEGTNRFDPCRLRGSCPRRT